MKGRIMASVVCTLVTVFSLASAADYYAAPTNISSVLYRISTRSQPVGIDRLLLTSGNYVGRFDLKSSHSNLVIMPAPNEKPVISGFVTFEMNKFTRVSANDANFGLMNPAHTNNIWVLDVSNQFSVSKPCQRGYPASNYFDGCSADPQVYVGSDGEKTRKRVARYPNTDDYLPSTTADMLSLVKNESPSASAVIPILGISSSGVLTFNISHLSRGCSAQTRLAAWRNSEFLMFDGVQSEAWVWTHVPVTTTSINFNSTHMNLVAPMVVDSSDYPMMNVPYRTNSAFFEGSPIDLDNDDEYFYDYNTRKVYIYSVDDLAKSTDKLFMSRNTTSIVFSSPSNVEITGLTFEGGAGTMISGDGANIEVNNCRFQNIPSTPISFWSNTLGSVIISNNRFTDIGRAVVKLGGTAVNATYEISYNRIRGWGWFEKVYAPAIGVSGTTGVEVKYNKISHSPHEAIHLNNYNHDVHHNDISSVVLEFRDMGAIYASNAKSSAAFTEGNFDDQNLNIHHNFLHNFGGWGQYAVYVDDLASGWNIQDNYFVDTYERPCKQANAGSDGNKYAAVYVHGGVKNTVRANHFLNTGRSYRYLDSAYADSKSFGSACGYQRNKVTGNNKLYDNFTTTATVWARDDLKKYGNVFSGNFWYNTQAESNLRCASSVYEKVGCNNPTKVVPSGTLFYTIEKHKASTRRNATTECEIPGFATDFPHLCGQATGNTASGFFKPTAATKAALLVQTKLNSLQPNL